MPHTPQPATQRRYYPDALTDTTARRARRAAGRAGIMARLLTATGGEAPAWLVVPLGEAKGAEFYSADVNLAAHHLAAEIVGDSPAWVVLQRGKNGGAHLNIFMPKDAVPERELLPERTYIAPNVWDVEGVTAYLSGPSDQLAAKSRHPIGGYRLLPTATEMEQAGADLLEARRLAGGKRLPRMSWTVNLPTAIPLTNTLRVSNYVTPPKSRPRRQTKVILAQSALNQGKSAAEAAQHAQISLRTLRRWLAEGHVTAPSQPQPEAKAKAVPIPSSGRDDLTPSTPHKLGKNLDIPYLAAPQFAPLQPPATCAPARHARPPPRR